MCKFRTQPKFFLYFAWLITLSQCIHSSDRNVIEPQFTMMSGWVSPVDKDVTLTQKFRPKYNSKHKGIDLAGRMNQPLYAANNGVVTYRGDKFRGYGQMILLEHSEGWTTLYSHLSKFNVSNGDRVRAGQVIGYMGRSGRASGVHLHFEIYKNKIPIDPLRVIPIQYKSK